MRQDLCRFGRLWEYQRAQKKDEEKECALRRKGQICCVLVEQSGGEAQGDLDEKDADHTACWAEPDGSITGCVFTIHLPLLRAVNTLKAGATSSHHQTGAHTP